MKASSKVAGATTTLLLLARRRGAEVEVLAERAEITRLGAEADIPHRLKYRHFSRA